eukprot:gene7394-10075_t
MGCCCSKSKTNDKNNVDDQDILNLLRDLVINPNIIDSELDDHISEWQDALNDYESFEQDCLDDDVSLSMLINKIRNSPEMYLESFYSSAVRELAEKRILLVKLQARLGLRQSESSYRINDSRKSKQIAADLIQAKNVGNLNFPKNSTDLHNARLPNISSEKKHNSITSLNNQSRATSRTRTTISDILSYKWASRLNEINITQGEINILPNSTIPENETSVAENTIASTNKKFKLKPKWPDFLIDTKFEVIKINKFGQNMRRILKLTQHHIISIKNGTEITKFYSLKDIKRCWLENGNIIKVYQKNKKMNIYLSIVAPHILQQIITRVQVRLSLDKTEFVGPVNISSVGVSPNGGSSSKSNLSTGLHSLGYSNVVTADLIKAISDGNTLETDAVVASFASNLKARTIRTLSADFKISNPFDSPNNANESFSRKSIPIDISDSVGDPLRLTDITLVQNNSISSNNTNTPKLSGYKEGTPEYIVSTVVQKIIFNAQTPEGNTRKLFMDNFVTQVATSNQSDALLQMRHFIDGMHEHILSKFGVKLSNVYVAENRRQENKSINKKNNDNQSPLKNSIVINVNNNNNLSNEERHSSSSDTGNDTMNPMNYHIVDNNQADSTSKTNSNESNITNHAFRRRSLQKIVKENSSLSQIEDSLLTFLSYIIFIIVEEAIFLPLKHQILKLLPSYNLKDETQSFLLKKKQFSSRSQLQWGVAEDFVSPLGWQTAIFELQGIEHNLTPSSQLQALTRTVKSIYNEFKLVLLPKLTEKGKLESCISADDLVPIFLYVFCQCELKHPMLNRDLMWSLCHPDQLQGEGGYYLTVYESCIEFIVNELPDSDKFDNTRAMSISMTSIDEEVFTGKNVLLSPENDQDGVELSNGNSRDYYDQDSNSVTSTDSRSSASNNITLASIPSNGSKWSLFTRNTTKDAKPTQETNFAMRESFG